MTHSYNEHPQTKTLFTPWDWKELPDLSNSTERLKIERAKELGVIAVLFSKNQLNTRIEDIAKLEHYSSNGDVNNTVYASLLKGAIPFTTPLFSNISSLRPQMNPIVDYMQASRYGTSQEGQNSVRILRKLDPKTDIAGKIFKIVDDVIDEGITADQVAKFALDPELCFELGEGITGPAKSVGMIALGDKGISKLNNFKEESVVRGVWLPNAWVGGRGLDGPNEAMRWADEFVLTNVQHEKYRAEMPEILDILGPRAVMGMDDISWISD